MAARNDERQKRRFQIRMAEKVRKNMAFHVINADQRLIRGKTESLCRGHADEQGSYQAGAVRDADMIHLGQSHARFIKRLFNDGHDIFNMLP